MDETRRARVIGNLRDMGLTQALISDPMALPRCLGRLR